MPKLSDTRIRAAKPKAKPYKLYDTDGLFLIINPNGSKWWRQRYRYAGKEQMLSLGVYGEIGLAEAREKSREMRKSIARDLDPSAQRKQRRAAFIDAQANTFKSIALAWHGRFKDTWKAHHADRVLQRLEDNVFPWIGDKPIRAVTSADIIACIDRMADGGKHETARRVLQTTKRVFKWAIGRGLAATSPAAHIDPREQLPSKKVKHRAAIKDPVLFGSLLRAIDVYQGGFVVRCALKLLALTFVRPGELRHAQWPEFDLDSREPTWRIPATRMKMGGEDHIVPLSRQVLAVLREIQPFTGHDWEGYVFPGLRNTSRPLSENTLNIAVRTMGFTREQHCSHGFRGTASTLLNEQQWNKDAIELQLAHMERDEVRQSYNSAKLLPERRRMMQAGADYLDVLKEDTKRNKVVAIRQRA